MMAPWLVPLGPRSWGWRSWDQGGSGPAERGRPVPRDAMGVAGVGQDVAQRDAGGGHGRQHGGERGNGVVTAGGQGHAAGQFRDGRSLLVRHHDRGRQVVAEEQLVLVVAQVVPAVPPGCLGVGAVAGPARRGPGEGLQVAPVHGQRAAGVPELFRDGCFQQAVAGALQFPRRQPVRLVLGERPGEQAEGVLSLPVGQQVRAVLPVREDAEPPLLALGQADQGLVDSGQVRGPAVGEGEHHAQQQGADGQLAAPGARRQQGLGPRRDAGGVQDALGRRQRDHGRVAPSRRTACSSPPGSRPATRSPSR